MSTAAQHLLDWLRDAHAQEIAMADWLTEHMPEITFAFLSRDADPEAVAKR